MAFLKFRPLVNLVDGDGPSKYACFTADLHTVPIPRADVNYNKAFFNDIEKYTGAYMLRATCRLDFVCLVADERGLMLLVHHSTKDNLYNVRRMLLNIFSNIPEEQKKLLQQTCRPMDQIDAERVQEWVDLESLRPIPPKPWKPKAYNMEEVRKRTIEDCSGRNLPFLGSAV